MSIRKPRPGVPSAGVEPTPDRRTIPPDGDPSPRPRGGLRLGPGFAAVVGAAVLLLPGLGRLDLWAPDEPRYAAVAEELRSHRHGPAGLALLRLNDAPYTQKPPLYFWTAAVVGSSGGRVTEWAARLPSALCGLLCVVLLVHCGARLVDRNTAALAGMILVTAFEFAHRARRAQLDVMLTLFESIALFAFWRLQNGSQHRARDIAVLHGALGLAVLTKGPVGILVPLLVMATFLVLERRTRRLWDLLPPWALALSLGPGLVWITTALLLAPPGSFHEAVTENLFGRFFAGTSHARPITYFLLQFPVTFLPWTLLWPVVGWFAWKRVFVPGSDPQRRRRWRFCLVWVAVSLVFFSLSAGKRGLYLLPVFPAAALLCAETLGALLPPGRDFPRRLGRWLAGLAVALPAAALAAAAAGGVAGVRLPASYGAGLALAAVGAGIAWRAAGRAAAPGLMRFAVVAGGVLLFELATFTLAFPALEPEKSPRPIALEAAERTAPDEPVGLAFKRTLLGGLHYYAKRPVRVLDDSAAMAAFFDAGGRVIVVPAKHLARVNNVAPVEIRGRYRSGERALLVVESARLSGSPRTPARPRRRAPAGEWRPPRSPSSRRTEPAGAGSMRSGPRCRGPGPGGRARPTERTPPRSS
jgi:4-amino-4-deoxy-L-arabinose transferase-like glycosyltransferase